MKNGMVKVVITACWPNKMKFGGDERSFNGSIPHCLGAQHCFGADKLWYQFLQKIYSRFDDNSYP